MEDARQTKDYEFKYDGDSHEIDINTLLASQFHWAALIHEVHTALYPDTKIDIKIKALERGSFDVIQVVEVSALAGMFALEHMHHVPDIFSTIADILSIKLFLKDRKAEEVTTDGINITIICNGGTLDVSAGAFNIYKDNDVVTGALEEMSKALDKSDDIDAIEINEIEDGEKENIAKVDRDQFEDLGSSNPYLDKETDEEVEEVVVAIYKLELNPGKKSKWSFIYKNRKINQVAILDSTFLESVPKQRFGAGDRLRVRMLKKLKKDPVTGMFLEHKFEILEVLGIIWRDEDGKLDL